jgi:hypothetical protein
VIATTKDILVRFKSKIESLRNKISRRCTAIGVVRYASRSGEIIAERVAVIEVLKKSDDRAT